MGASQTKRILVVEDDLATAETVSAVLEGEGYDTSIARNGREALDRLKQRDAPDLILLDLRMPIMDGWSFRTAQRRSSALAPIPVIAMSADGTSQAEAISANGFLKKPLSMPTLLEAVERVLSESDRQRESDRWTMVERMASLGQVAAGVGHEINNPLAFVMLNVTQVRDELRGHAGGIASKAEDLAQALDESLIGLGRIRDIVQNVQMLSRKSDPRREPVRLDRVVDDSITLARSHLLRARITKRYAEAPPVMGSPGALGQVFLNLLVNAAQALSEDARDRNEISVAITFDGKDVTVEIADTGRGIAPEILPHVFDPFFTTKGSDEGTGLGLTICQRIITDHGGTLKLDSDVGRGTSCRVSLGAIREEAAHAPASQAVKPARTEGAKRRRILVIDDEPMIGAVIIRTLSSHHDVVFTHDPREALGLLERGTPFDVVLCDLTMPAMSGSEVFDVLRARWPELAAHTAFMTGGASTERAKAYLQETARPVLYKPFSSAELTELIAGQLGAAGGD